MNITYLWTFQISSMMDGLP